MFLSFVELVFYVNKVQCNSVAGEVKEQEACVCWRFPEQESVGFDGLPSRFMDPSKAKIHAQQWFFEHL